MCCLELALQRVDVRLELGLGSLLRFLDRCFYFALHIRGCDHEQTTRASVEQLAEFLEIGSSHPACDVTGDGADVVNGGDGDDTLNGGNGVDRLVGDRGADTMNGGAAVRVASGAARPRVCVIGAGISGLVTAKVFLADGFDVTVFEKEAELGGVWASTRTYPGLHANNPRETYAFATVVASAAPGISSSSAAAA